MIFLNLCTVLYKDIGFPGRHIPVFDDPDLNLGIEDGYDWETAFYDIFYKAGFLYFIGPPRIKEIDEKYFSTLSADGVPLPTDLIEFSEIRNCSAVRVAIAEKPLMLKFPNGYTVEPSLSPQVSFPKKMFFLLQKNNKLNHLRAWCRINRILHGSDVGFIIYDNASTEYSVEDLDRELSNECESIFIKSFPFKYGPNNDKGQHDFNYLQYACIKHASIMFFDSDGYMVQTDVDEIFMHYNLFEEIRRRDVAVLSFKGQWVFTEDVNVFGDREARFCDHFIKSGSFTNNKYIFDVSKCGFPAQFFVHSVSNVASSFEVSQEYYHFRLITNNWKYDRFKNIPKEKRVFGFLTDDEVRLLEAAERSM